MRSFQGHEGVSDQDPKLQAIGCNVLNLSGLPHWVELSTRAWGLRDMIPPLATARELFDSPDTLPKKLDEWTEHIPGFGEHLCHSMKRGIPLLALLHPSFSNQELVLQLANQLFKQAGGEEVLGSAELIMTTPLSASRARTAERMDATGRAALLNVSHESLGILCPRAKAIEAILPGPVSCRSDQDWQDCILHHLPREGSSQYSKMVTSIERRDMLLAYSGRGVPELERGSDRHLPHIEAVRSWLHDALPRRDPFLLFVGKVTGSK